LTVATSGIFLLGCEPKLVVGDWFCPWDAETGAGGATSGDSGDESAHPRPGPRDPVAVPWSTSFESGFCDFWRAGGFCYEDADAESSIVTAPVHTGKFAAAFRVRGDGEDQNRQARCVRQGVFPTEAYYSAWYFIPQLATNRGLWNLFHFRGAKIGPGPTNLAGLWDVSLAGDADAGLRLFLYDFLPSPTPSVDAFPAVPIGEWFQIEVYFRRASDATGELAVYQDGERVFRVTDLVTDDTDWGQWYVGNLATALMPPDSTVYVDDVTIRATQ
jgi:hypothetical protein